MYSDTELGGSLPDSNSIRLTTLSEVTSTNSLGKEEIKDETSGGDSVVSVGDGATIDTIQLAPLTGGLVASPIPVIVQDTGTVVGSQTPCAASLRASDAPVATSILSMVTEVTGDTGFALLYISQPWKEVLTGNHNPKNCLNLDYIPFSELDNLLYSEADVIEKI